MSEQAKWRRVVYVVTAAVCLTAIVSSWMRGEYRYQAISHSSLFVFDKHTGKYYNTSGQQLPVVKEHQQP
jgi:hypothetical protein